MKMKVAQYIEQYLAESGINQVFTVVGGGAMHLNDAFGHSSRMSCIYNHHEQASAMAAESYARIAEKPGIVCVTSGPGATNAITGVVGAWVDSVPMIVISGQTKYSLTVRNSGLNLRCLGNQEVDILSIIQNITKFSIMLINPNDVKYVLGKALYMAQNGRPGPVWIDIPLDVQGSLVETDDLKDFSIKDTEEFENLDLEIDLVVKKLKEARRPVLYVGNGIRLSKAYDEFRDLIVALNIPVVTCWNSIDLIEDDNPLYAGRAGTMGNRAGNFAVQNADVLLCIGTRLNIYQVGYDVNTWAREAFTVVVDIDNEELKKPTVRIDLAICADAKEFIKRLVAEIEKTEYSCFDKWIEKCNYWKMKYPVISEKHYEIQKKANVYAFIDKLSEYLPPGCITIVANGSASVVGSQAFHIKQSQRFVMNCELSSMGYDLPAAIGACIANEKREVICIAGDGSIQMNLQELQTIITNNLPIKIFIINNEGYQQIRLTQKNLFAGKPLIGVGAESGDLGFPSFKNLADVYGYRYYACTNNEDLTNTISLTLGAEEPTICEIFVTTDQAYEPKSATKRLNNGTLVSPPLEDLAPFLSKQELKQNMFIGLINENGEN